MTKEQLYEANILFIDGIPEEEHEDYEKCFLDLEKLWQIHGTILRDCMMYLSNKAEMEAEQCADDEEYKDAELDALLIWGGGGNA